MQYYNDRFVLCNFHGMINSPIIYVKSCPIVYEYVHVTDIDFAIEKPTIKCVYRYGNSIC